LLRLLFFSARHSPLVTAVSSGQREPDLQVRGSFKDPHLRAADVRNTSALRLLQREGDGEDAAADERQSPTITSESATIQELSDFAIP